MDTPTCNYSWKTRHVKVEGHVLKAKNKKEQRFEHKGSYIEEMNFCGLASTSEVKCYKGYKHPGHKKYK